LLYAKNLILAGDLNFTIGADEVWGPAAHLDRHAGFFLDMIKEHSLVDLAPDILIPTWRNGRSGDVGIEKRLDRTLVSESLLQEVGCYRSWVELPFISDHAVVITQLDFNEVRIAYPFKLNSMWLVETDFTGILNEVWHDGTFLEEPDIQRIIVWKLKTLKSRVKVWARKKRKEKLHKW
jgi:hypothetical protein